MTTKSDWSDSAFGSGWFGRWTDDDRRNAERFVSQWRDELRRANEVAQGLRGAPGSVARVQSAMTEVAEIIEHLQAFMQNDVPGAASLQFEAYDVLSALNVRLQDLVDQGKSMQPPGAHMIYR